MYTEKKQVSTHVKIHPRDQNNIQNAVTTELTSLVGKCTCKDGYILSVEDIEISKKSNSYQISDCGAWIIVPVNYFICSYKPHPGQIIDVRISNIIPGGIIFNYMNYLSVFSTEDKNTKLQIGDRVRVIISDVRFKNQKYDGLCKIIEILPPNIV